MTKMFNPAHPGLVVGEYLREVTVTEAAKAPGVTRAIMQKGHPERCPFIDEICSPYFASLSSVRRSKSDAS